MHAAKESQQFWDILDAAIGLGRSLANYETFGDRALEELILHGHLQNRGKSSSRSTQIIRELMANFQKEHKHEATAKKLLVWVGGSTPSADDQPLIFAKDLADSLAGMTWEKWSNTVKDLKKKRK